MSARPFAVGGRLAVPSVYIAAEPGRVGQALPLPGDRVAQGGKLRPGVAPTCFAGPRNLEVVAGILQKQVEFATIDVWSWSETLTKPRPVREGK